MSNLCLARNPDRGYILKISSSKYVVINLRLLYSLQNTMCYFKSESIDVYFEQALCVTSLTSKSLESAFVLKVLFLKTSHITV